MQANTPEVPLIASRYDDMSVNKHIDIPAASGLSLELIPAQQLLENSPVAL